MVWKPRFTYPCKNSCDSCLRWKNASDHDSVTHSLEKKTFPFVVRWGPVSIRLPVAAPGNRCCVFRCLQGVCVLVFVVSVLVSLSYVCMKSGLSDGTKSLGCQLDSCILAVIAFLWAVPLVGPWLLCTKFPQGVSPEMRGGPWAPPTRGVDPQSVQCRCCFVCGTGLFCGCSWRFVFGIVHLFVLASQTPAG